MNALLGDQVSTGIDTLVDQIEMHRGGKTRILATSGATRSTLLPDVPTFTEANSTPHSTRLWPTLSCASASPAWVWRSRAGAPTIWLPT